jgi:hypothetical protein
VVQPLLMIRELWCRGLTCLPVTQEIAGSNPVSSAKHDTLIYREDYSLPGIYFYFLEQELMTQYSIRHFSEMNEKSVVSLIFRNR